MQTNKIVSSDDPVDCYVEMMLVPYVSRIGGIVFLCCFCFYVLLLSLILLKADVQLTEVTGRDRRREDMEQVLIIDNK